MLDWLSALFIGRWSLGHVLALLFLDVCTAATATGAPRASAADTPANRTTRLGDRCVLSASTDKLPSCLYTTATSLEDERGGSGGDVCHSTDLGITLLIIITASLKQRTDL